MIVWQQKFDTIYNQFCKVDREKCCKAISVDFLFNKKKHFSLFKDYKWLLNPFPLYHNGLRYK